MDPEAPKVSSTPIKDIEPIRESRNCYIRTRDELKKYVEAPLLKACEDLWDKNIRTLASTANHQDVGNSASLILEYDSLSDANKLTAEKVGKMMDNYDGMQVAVLESPITEETAAEEIEDVFLDKTRQFTKQKASWVIPDSLEEMRSAFPGSSDNEIIGYLIQNGYYYDSDKKEFYLSEELFNKSHDD